MFGAKLFPSSEQFSNMCDTHNEKALGFNWTLHYTAEFFTVKHQLAGLEFLRQNTHFSQEGCLSTEGWF